jgi:hypothetical protein
MILGSVLLPMVTVLPSFSRIRLSFKLWVALGRDPERDFSKPVAAASLGQVRSRAGISEVPSLMRPRALVLHRILVLYRPSVPDRAMSHDPARCTGRSSSTARSRPSRSSAPKCSRCAIWAVAVGCTTLWMPASSHASERMISLFHSAIMYYRAFKEATKVGRYHVSSRLLSYVWTGGDARSVPGARPGLHRCQDRAVSPAKTIVVVAVDPKLLMPAPSHWICKQRRSTI